MEVKYICNHENCLLSALRGLRNGIYYGGKVRFTHSLVMTILFKDGTLLEKIKNIINLTFEHAINLGGFVFIYKLASCILKNIFRSDNKLINFLAGFIGSFFIWARKTSVNQQIMLFLLSRDILAGANIICEKVKTDINGFPLATMLVWAIVMFLFEYKPQSLQGSLLSSMKFLYHESDKWNNWKDFIPFHIPNFN